MALIPLTNVTKDDLTGKIEKGLVNKLWICLRSDIETIPDIDGVDLAGSVTISGDVVFKSGKNFYELDFTRKTGELKFTLEGGDDSKVEITTLEVSAPTWTPILRGFVKNYKNQDVVIVARESCGDFYILGDHCLSMQMSVADGTTGKDQGDYKGIVMTWETVGMPTTYNGVISTTPAV